MGSPLGALKTLFVPALISLTIFLVISYVLVPFVRRYRERYSQYLPIQTISAHTSSLRERVSDTVMRFVLRINLRRRQVESQGEETESDSGFGEEGEEMGVPTRGTTASERGDLDSTARLSRDLEQGFMDDSDEDDDVQRVILGQRNGNA